MPSQFPQNSPSAPEHPQDSFLDALVRPFFEIRNDEQFNADPKISTPETFLAKLREEITDDAQFERAQKNFQEVMDATRQYAKSMGVSDPEIRMTQEDHSAYTSSNDKNYVIFNENEMRVLITMDSELAMRIAKNIGGHEVAHIAGGDLAPWRNGVILSPDMGQRKAEMVADIVGTGPLGSHDPSGLADYWRASLYIHTRAMNWTNPTEIELRDASAIYANEHDRRHIPMGERIDYLERTAVLMKEYEATHNVVTLEDRKKESDWLVQQITREYEQGKIPPVPLLFKDRSGEQPAASVSETVPDNVKSQVQGMTSLPMQEVDKHTIAYAPASTEPRRLG